MLVSKTSGALSMMAMTCLIGISSLSAQDAPVSNSFQVESQVETQQLVRTNRVQLTLMGAEKAIVAGRKKAEEMGILVNIAVVDEGGHLLAFARMDGARPASVYTSITKATSAATKRGPTGPLPNADAINTHLSLAVERAARASGGKFTTLKGGVPILYGDQVIGAIGVGGATGEQDAEVASAGVSTLTSAFKNSSDESRSSNSRSLYQKWLVEDLNGAGVIDNAQTTIQVNQNGSITGSTGVNRYMGKAKIDGQKLKIEPGPATTRAAGPPALMDQEARFLALLPKVKQYRIDENGLLRLLDSQGKQLLRASPMD
ncbi:heme-binding protein [Thalassoglobus sp.]|uniref:heme-binding protein n=1 Tax=Thalassoglobus sp. TaxID=2795869 RepID=UPI003AA83CA0